MRLSQSIQFVLLRSSWLSAGSPTNPTKKQLASLTRASGRPFCLLVVVALAAATPALFGATATTNFSVTASVPASCAVSATNLAFGTYAGGVANATSTLSVTCTNTTPYNVGLNAGTASGATVTTRQMSGSSSLLSYALYSDSGRSLNWGQTVGTDTVTGTGNGGAQSLSVYGQVPASQFPNPGSYTDTITVTVTY